MRGALEDKITDLTTQRNAIAADMIDMLEGAAAIAVAHVVRIAARGKVHAHPVGAPHRDGGIGGLEKEPRAVLHGVGKSRQPQQVANDGVIRAAAEDKLLHRAADTELLGQPFLESRLARSAAGKQGAVNVEQANVHGLPHSSIRVPSA